MQIQISWLLQKPTDLDLHCLQRQGISGFSRTKVKDIILHDTLRKNPLFMIRTKGNGYIFRVGNSGRIGRSPSEKGSIIKRKSLLPWGANYFSLQQTPFLKGLGVQESEQEV